MLKTVAKKQVKFMSKKKCSTLARLVEDEAHYFNDLLHSFSRFCSTDRGRSPQPGRPSASQTTHGHSEAHDHSCMSEMYKRIANHFQTKFLKKGAS